MRADLRTIIESPKLGSISNVKVDSVHQQLLSARDEGKILASSYENCRTWLNPSLFEAWVIESIFELVENSCWVEINDRFYKTLAFGTGGLRGRTIGRVVTKAEQGNRPKGECPQYPAVGSNCMNDFNVRRATMGLVAYIQSIGSSNQAPHAIFAHDTRFFSRHFAELAAATVIEFGGKASLFESERSTPELSFAVRYLNADAGVVVTASHNPPHDNGYKAYFNDGAQVVEPHASGIIRRVNEISLELATRKTSASSKPEKIGAEVDAAYRERLFSLVLEPKIIRETGSRLKVVYSPLHGTGAKMVPDLIQKMGCAIVTIPEQMIPDGRFPTVKSPNPENAEALTLSIRRAEQEDAELVLATDPDADRMGVAVRNREGRMELLTGNQIGSILAYYRLERLFAQSVLNPTNRARARLIKTVVTTDLQRAIAEKFGVGIPETLTGFKYIGEKLRKYEERFCAATGMDPKAYRRLPEEAKREQLLQHSCYYVFGGEESYGYSASDFARDKDANAACIMFTEVLAFAKTRDQTLLDYLDGIYSELGYYQEKLGQLVYEGAEGADKIKRLLRSYESHPPREMKGLEVTQVTNYAKEDVYDSEGDLLPKELLFFVSLQNGTRYAVRGSGTEPKVKFYLFGKKQPLPGQRFSSGELAGIKAEMAEYLDSLWKAIETDAHNRADEKSM